MTHEPSYMTLQRIAETAPAPKITEMYQNTLSSFTTQPALAAQGPFPHSMVEH